jgi:hypothetical protein
MADVPLKLMDMVRSLAANPLRASVVEVLAKSSPILDQLSFIPTPSGVYSFDVEASLPTPDFGSINTNPEATKGTDANYKFSCKVMDGKAQIDERLLKIAEAVNDPTVNVQRQLAAHMKAIKKRFEVAFFDGDSNSDPRQFNGLNKLLVYSSGNYQNLISAGTNGATLTVSMLDDLISAVDGGPPDVLIVGKAMEREITKLARDNKQITITQDQFGNQYQTYGGIPMLQAGKDSSNAEILQFDETQGTSSVTGSIYAVRFNTDDGLCGIQQDMPNMLDPQKDGFLTNLFIYWMCGIALHVPNSCIRLKGVKQS